MKTKKSHSTGASRSRKTRPATDQTNGRRTHSASHEPAKLTGQPGGGAGRADRVGEVPGDTRVDPNLTERHPGYDETGPSEIIPVDEMLDAEEGKNED
jgi:hypothetical protein